MQNNTERTSGKLFGIPRNVFFLGLVSFFNDCSNEMILSVFPAFFKSVLKTGAASLGVVEGIADGASNLIKIASGTFSDRIQVRKKLAIAGYALSVATRPFYILTNHVLFVAGLRVTDRIGKGVREAPRDALISLASEQHELGKSFGYHKAMDSFGAIIGPLVAYLILKRTPDNFRAIFITAFIAGLCALLTFFFVTEAHGIVRKVRATMPSLRSFTKNFKLFILATFVLACGTIPVAVMLLRTIDAGYSLATIPLFYLVYNVSFTISSYAAGKSADKIGDRRIITLGYLILIASYGLLVIATSGIILVVGFILLGLYSALTESIQRSYVGRLSAPELRGEAFGFLSGALGFGSLAAGLGGGFSWEFLGAPVTLIVASLIVVVGLILLQLHAKSY